MKRIHVVFQQADVTTLQQAIEMDESLRGEIFEIKDDFAVGPINGLDTDDNWNARVEWWRGLLDASPYQDKQLAGSFDDRQTIVTITNQLQNDPDLELWIWMGQNQHDVCGY